MLTDAALKEATRWFAEMPPEEQAKLQAAQRKSWAIGEMMLAHPEMTRAEAERLYYEMDRLANDGLPLGRRWWPQPWNRFWS